MAIDRPAGIQIEPPVASNERLSAALRARSRLTAVNAAGIVDGGPEPMFDRFARLASRVADVPVALVSVVTDDRQYFAGLCGLPQPWADARQTPLSHSVCQHVVANGAPLVLEDARADPVMHSNLAVVEFGVVAYAGFPIISPSGHVLGSLCAIDGAPRQWDPDHLLALADITVLLGNELERRELMRRLAIDARTDALTGMANRREWDEKLPVSLRRAERLGHPLTVALIDLDHFKDFNDRHGHPGGDGALHDIGGRWRAQVRDVDLLARIGGEEFGLLLPGCDVDAALEVVERLRADVPDGITVSAGIVRWERGTSAEGLIADADRALYRAKRDGRDRAWVGST